MCPLVVLQAARGRSVVALPAHEALQGGDRGDVPRLRERLPDGSRSDSVGLKFYLSTRPKLTFNDPSAGSQISFQISTMEWLQQT